MGKTIDNQKTPDAHRTISRALAGFAQEAATTVRQHEGELIYSGGDDVLALLPLHRAWRASGSWQSNLQREWMGLRMTRGTNQPFRQGWR